MRDIDKFALRFDSAVMIKRVKSGLEVRVHNLDVGRQLAIKFIQSECLHLEIVNEGSMSLLKAFLVREV